MSTKTFPGFDEKIKIAKNVERLVNELNLAIRSAVEADLVVDVEVDEVHKFGAASPIPVVEIEMLVKLTEGKDPA